MLYLIITFKILQLKQIILRNNNENLIMVDNTLCNNKNKDHIRYSVTKATEIKMKEIIVKN